MTVAGSLCSMAHRTVRCTPDSPVPLPRHHCRWILTVEASDLWACRGVRCTPDMHCLMSGAPVWAALTSARAARAFNARLRAQRTEHAQKAHRTVYRTCPVHHRTAQRPPPVRAPTVRTQRPADVAGTPDTVRWRTRLSGALCDRQPSNGHFWWLGL